MRCVCSQSSSNIDFGNLDYVLGVPPLCCSMWAQKVDSCGPVYSKGEYGKATLRADHISLLSKRVTASMLLLQTFCMV